MSVREDTQKNKCLISGRISKRGEVKPPEPPRKKEENILSGSTTIKTIIFLCVFPNKRLEYVERIHTYVKTKDIRGITNHIEKDKISCIFSTVCFLKMVICHLCTVG